MPHTSEMPLSDDSPQKPRNKGGRPKGSKTRPKWLREALKRPRGRPKGSKNKPKTILGFLQDAMEIETPKRAPPKKPKSQKHVELGKLAQAKLTPEMRKERGLQGAEAAARSKNKPGRREGVPQAFNEWTYRAIQDEAKQDVQRIMKLMEDEGILPEDPLAREALQTALQLMREPGPKPFKHQVLRTILEYRLAKPTAKTDVTVRTAEDWLDALAAQEANESTDDDADEPTSGAE